jgi:hypothetical protein
MKAATRNFFTLRNAICLPALFFILATAVYAQPNLTFKRMTVNLQTIELYFSVSFDGNPATIVSKQNFRIQEDGIEVGDFTLWCSGWSMQCRRSVAFVVNGSESMIGDAQSKARQAAHAYVDLMDGEIDEAVVLGFTSVVTVYQQMTTCKASLRTAIDSLSASGSAALWDGLHAGVTELIDYGFGECRAVILLTDGEDNASSRTPAEIIALANRHNIRVFTVVVGDSSYPLDLQMIADLTGGRFYRRPDADQIATIYRHIPFPMIHLNGECLITYETACADGGLRTVDLELHDFRGGSDVKTRTYRAPLLPLTFTTLAMQLGTGEGKGATEIAIPLNLLTPINNDLIFPFRFTLEFDSACVQFKSVSTPPGSLLRGAPISMTPMPNGVLIEVKDQKLINGHGPLMEFAFVASDLADTTSCEIRAVGPTFEQGCFVPIIDPGEIRIYPRNTTISSGGFMQPRSTHLLQCHPNPFNPTTVIPYRLGELTDYTLTLYDMLGRRLRVLEAGRKEAGSYHYEFDAGDLTSGVYLYRLETPTFSDTKRMILSR